MPDPAVPAPRRVLYVVSRFPVHSHTFTANEMAAVAEAGVEVFVAPIWKTLPGEIPHAVERPFLARRVWEGWSSPRLWWGALKGLARRPRALGTVLRLVPGHLQSIWLPFKLLAAIPRGFFLGEWCAEHGIEQIHAHFLSSPTTVALIASAVSGVPYSFTAHAFDITSRHPRHLSGSIPLKARRAALGVTISQYSLRYMHDRWPELRRAPLDVIYNGIDTSLFAPDGRGPILQNAASSPVRVLSVARLQEKKGYEVLIPAVARLRERGVNIELDIFGEGPLRAPLQALIDALGQAEHIRLCGPLLQEQLVKEYQQADLFALACVPLPSGDADGLPTVLIEALAAGLPAVSTTVAGVPEIVQEGITGRCVPPRDVDAFADALAWLIDHPAEARTMGQRGRALVLERFDRRHNAARLLARWREIHGG